MAYRTSLWFPRSLFLFRINSDMKEPALDRRKEHPLCSALSFRKERKDDSSIRS